MTQKIHIDIKADLVDGENRNNKFALYLPVKMMMDVTYDTLAWLNAAKIVCCRQLLA